MKRGQFFLLVLLLISHLGAAQPISREEQYVLDLSKRKFDWLISRQYDSLNKLMDERILYIHSNGWTQTKRDVIDDLQSGKLNYQKVSLKETKVRLYGTAAIVTGLGTFEGAAEGKTFAMDLRYTEVYIKNGSHWKLASRHSNRMP
jgi:hypothetical protein